MKQQGDHSRTIAEEICAEYSRLSSDRSTFESHWEEVARLVVPNYSGSFTANSFRTPGQKRTEHQYDATAGIAASRFSAVMESLLTPRNQRWQRIMPGGPHKRELMKDRETRLWLEQVTDILFQYRNAPKANFQNQMREGAYFALGTFGTGCVFVDELQGGGLRYRAIPLSEIYFSENHQGVIDRAIRRFKFTARQAYRQWGDRLPEKIIIAAKEKPETEFFFLHCVKPREDLDTTRMDHKGKPFVSYYCSETEKFLLSEGGYNTFPFAISRYVKVPGETYGRSPAMEVLPAIKVLNEQKKTVLKQGHRTVDPVLLAYDDGVIDTFSLKPGAVNAGGVSADGRALVQALPVGNLAIAQEMMDAERATINDAFLITLFQILVESPQMTATEVLERAREKGMLISPTMGRQESELLGPMAEREVDLLVQQRLLPPMPPALKEAQGEYELEYDNPLSRAQRAEEAAGLSRVLSLTLDVVKFTENREPLDHFDWDTIIPEVSDTQAVPMRWMRSKDAIDAIRQARAEQAETATAIEAAPAAAAMMKTMMPQGAPAK